MLPRNVVRVVLEATFQRRCRLVALPAGSKRFIHQTRPTLKAKKNQRSFAEEDEFDGPFEDDLFGSVKPSTSKQPASETQTFAAARPIEGVGKPSSVDLFNEQAALLVDRLGPKPTNLALQVRGNAIRKFLLYTTNSEQLNRVVDIVALWRSSGRKFDDGTTLDLIDRCLLYNPPLLVQIFSNRPKYGVDIPNIAEARRILYKIVTSRPHSVSSQGREALLEFSNTTLEHASLFAALYPLYGLGSALHDIESVSLLTLACANVILQTRLTVSGTREVYRKELGATKAGKDFEKLQSKLVEALRTHKSKLEASGVKTSDRRTFGQPYTDEEVGTVHKRIAGQTKEVDVDWRRVGTALYPVKVASEKLCGDKSADARKLFDEVMQGCFELKPFFSF